MASPSRGRSTRRPFVSTLAVTFKKAQATEDVEEAKKEHRANLKVLMDKYIADVASGKAEGIRSSREFVDVIKTDLLLMGEATDRTENANTVDEVRVQQINAILDDNDTDIQKILDDLYAGMNVANDRLGGVYTRPEDHSSKYEDGEQCDAVEGQEDIEGKEPVDNIE